jgi:putative transposase
MHKLSDLLKAASMARSTYYYQLRLLTLPDKDESIKDSISTIYHLHNGRYGYRRITLELHNNSIIINHKKVVRIMNELGIKSLVRPKKYRSYKGCEGKIAPNIIKRNFKAVEPNEKWTTDVTEFNLFGQKRYLSPILDMFNGEIISYTVSSSPNLNMVTNMLKEAISKRKKSKKLILHSDQGWHYKHPLYKKTLKDNGITQSMSRKGNCLDNAMMESFFGMLKSELFYLQKFNSMDEFEYELKNYIYYYNNYRIKTKLKGLSPVKYRTQSNY